MKRGESRQSEPYTGWLPTPIEDDIKKFQLLAKKEFDLDLDMLEARRVATQILQIGYILTVSKANQEKVTEALEEQKVFHDTILSSPRIPPPKSAHSRTNRKR